MSNRSDAIDTPGEYADLFMISLLVMVGSMFLGAVILEANPTLDEQIYYTFQDAPEYDGSESLEWQRSYFNGQNGLNQVYRESSTEFAFCLEVRDGTVESMKFPHAINEASESSITLQCQGDKQVNGLVHTHPGYFAVPELSGVDQRTLTGSDQLEISCVMSGQVFNNEYRNPDQFNCFNDDLEKLNVEIIEGTGSD